MKWVYFRVTPQTVINNVWDKKSEYLQGFSLSQRFLLNTHK